MATLYHLDGDQLMLTHYCSAGNQPRMRAATVSTEGVIEFHLLDTGHFALEEDGAVIAARIRDFLGKQLTR